VVVRLTPQRFISKGLLLRDWLQRAFVNAVMPVVSATVRHFEAGEAGHEKLDPAVRKALRRRARRKQEATAVRPPGEAAEQDTMFKVRGECFAFGIDRHPTLMMLLQGAAAEAGSNGPPPTRRGRPSEEKQTLARLHM